MPTGEALSRRYTPGTPVVGVAQLVELRIVVPAVAGSIPVAHPRRCRRAGIQPGVYVIAVGGRCSGMMSGSSTNNGESYPEQPQAADEDLRRLGEALNERTEDVLEKILARNVASGQTLDAMVEDSFARVGTVSTIAVARWMSGEPPEVAREVGRGVLADLWSARRAARRRPERGHARCLRWCDAASEVVRESAAALGTPPETLLQALAMLQRSLNVTLVRMCESFDSERKLADEQLEHRQEELAFLATHDPLTGLPNRTLILDRVEQMLARSRRKQTPVAALFVDLDNFKSINDTLGHEVGDELLEAVAARLDGVVRATDAFGRLGGDEFVVVSEELSLSAGPELIAERLIEALKEPFKLGSDEGTRLTVTASIGIASGDRTAPADLLRDADIAMYRAKWDGKNRYVVFETGMQDAVQTRMELEMDLRVALENEEFSLVYQPTFDLSDMSPTGVEALIRWNSPTRGTVQPDDFIPLLEETGLITQIGKWVLEEACRQGAAWRAAGHMIGMAVNVSARQFDTDQLIGDIESALSGSGLAPEALTIEITETTLMRNADETARRLTTIKGPACGLRSTTSGRLFIVGPPTEVPGGCPEDRSLVHLGSHQQGGG